MEENKVNGNVGVKDDKGVEILKRQLNGLTKEKEAYEKAIIDTEKSISNYEEQWLIDKRLLELQLEHFGMVDEKVTHKIQLVPEFWSLEKKKFEYRIREEHARADSYLTTHYEDLRLSKERLEKCTSEIERITKELSEVEV